MLVNPSLKQVADLFSEPPVVAEMQARLGMGLHPWEAEVVRRFFPPSGRVLDLGCGPGREAIALAKLGYQVVGVDVSGPVLECARENAVEAGVTVEWRLVDGLNVPAEPFAAVTLWAQVLGNIERREDQVALLANCRDALGPGGVISASGHHEAFCRETWGSQTEAEWFYPTGSWPAGELKYWMFTPKTLEALLTESGFEIIATEVPDSLKAIIHVVARRPE
ncbi:MAG: class I SAM-dependent methyltransferase [Armatimonadota bacterium]